MLNISLQSGCGEVLQCLSTVSSEGEGVGVCVRLGVVRGGVAEW